MGHRIRGKLWGIIDITNIHGLMPDKTGNSEFPYPPE